MATMTTVALLLLLVAVSTVTQVEARMVPLPLLRTLSDAVPVSKADLKQGINDALSSLDAGKVEKLRHKDLHTLLEETDGNHNREISVNEAKALINDLTNGNLPQNLKDLLDIPNGEMQIRIKDLEDIIHSDEFATAVGQVGQLLGR